MFDKKLWLDLHGDQGMDEEECMYCGAVVPVEEPPKVGDDEEWRRLAVVHNWGCEWVETRAHRRE